MNICGRQSYTQGVWVCWVHHFTTGDYLEMVYSCEDCPFNYRMTLEEIASMMEDDD